MKLNRYKNVSKKCDKKSNEPIEFFDALNSTTSQDSKVSSRNPYYMVRCFIGLLLWTSLAQFPILRAYFTRTVIYHLPHFTGQMFRNRFEQLLTMLHFKNNEKLPHDLGTERRLKSKLGDQLTAVNP